MKCFKMTNKPEIVRISDSQASKLFAQHKGIYMPKMVWKYQKSEAEYAKEYDTLKKSTK
jgi:hypothetical protein